MDLSGWISPEVLNNLIGRKPILTDQELYDAEPDRTDAQAKKIMDLMVKKGISKLTDIRGDFRPKSNGKISIGMAGQIIDILLNEK